MKKLIIPALVATLCLGLNSCKKEQVIKPNSKGNENRVLPQASKVSQNLLEYVYKYANPGNGLFRISNEPNFGEGSCANVTYDTMNPTKIIVLDWGSGCVQPDNGHVVAGKITITYTDSELSTAGSSIRFDYEDWHKDVDSMILNGSVEMQNLGLNGAGNVQGRITGSVAMTPTNGSGNATATLLVEMEDDFNNDRIYQTRTIDINSVTGKHLRESTLSLLVRNYTLGCSEHFVEGVVLIEESGKPDETLDYGTGRCDDEATLTINGVSTTVDLNQ